MKNNKTLKVPHEFEEFIDNLSIQISKELGTTKNKSQTMRLLASNFKDKLTYKNKKFDIKIF